jgi:nucleoside-diphosphate-sugar epimerase
LDRVLADSGLDVVITGGGGWIGRAVLEMVESALGDSFSTRVHVFGATRKTVRLRSGRRMTSEPLAGLRDLTIGPHVLAHLAFVTREHATSQSLSSYVATNEAISSAVLEFARRAPVEALFCPSSGAVYDPDGVPRADLRSNPYGALKLRDESRFMDVSPLMERTAVVRVFNLAGPFVNKLGSYALSSIITDVMQGGPVRLRADHPVIRSYVHVRDLVELAFGVMLGQTAGPGVPFDTAGEREVEIGELASLTARLLGSPEARIDRPPFAEGGRTDRYVGDGAMWNELASKSAVDLAPLEFQILDTAAFIAFSAETPSPDLPGR